MTVAELIEALKTLPQDMDVLMDTLHYGEPKAAEIGIELGHIDKFNAFTWHLGDAERPAVRIFDAS